MAGLSTKTQKAKKAILLHIVLLLHNYSRNTCTSSICPKTLSFGTSINNTESHYIKRPSQKTLGKRENIKYQKKRYSLLEFFSDISQVLSLIRLPKSPTHRYYQNIAWIVNCFFRIFGPVTGVNQQRMEFSGRDGRYPGPSKITVQVPLLYLTGRTGLYPDYKEQFQRLLLTRRGHNASIHPKSTNPCRLTATAAGSSVAALHLFVLFPQ